MLMLLLVFKFTEQKIDYPTFFVYLHHTFPLSIWNKSVLRPKAVACDKITQVYFQLQTERDRASIYITQQ